jgi:AraC-like DNA-binding protein
LPARPRRATLRGMSDDLPPVVTDITDALPRRGRRLSVMPNAPQIKGAERESLVAFMRERLLEIEKDYQDRIELIRAGLEHPLPLYAKLAHNHAAMGLPRTQIARLLGISVTTLERHYQDDLELGIAQINLKIASNVARKALSDDPDAAKIGLDWLDRRGGDQWRKSTQKIEVEDNKPPLIDISQLKPEEREALRAMLTRITEDAESAGVTVES